MADFVLNEHHRSLLALRSYKNKFGIDVSLDPLRTDMRALWELVVNGYVVKIDTFLYEGRILMDVYLLTKKGVELCERKGYWRRAHDDRSAH